MNKFVGYWNFKNEPSSNLENPGNGSTLHIRFTNKPREVNSQGIVEYRTGHAIPKPADGALTDPLKHYGLFRIILDPVYLRLWVVGLWGLTPS